MHEWFLGLGFEMDSLCGRVHLNCLKFNGQFECMARVERDSLCGRVSLNVVMIWRNY